MAPFLGAAKINLDKRPDGKILKDAGVTVQTVLRRFGGKEALLASAVKILAVQIRARRGAALCALVLRPVELRPVVVRALELRALVLRALVVGRHGSSFRKT